ncbi:MAG: ribose 5-phosphate isomerase B [Bacteroidia bacterium]|jgi:ribose 5-phosphate isomerase B
MKLAIAADHAGYELKEFLKEEFKLQHQFIDFGTHSTNSMDYPDVAHPLANAIENKQADLGIIICGSGNGVNMTVNKHAGIRAALCWTNEIASLARQHNNANVLSIPARFVSHELAKQMVETFLAIPFEGGRHANRVDKIKC